MKPSCISSTSLGAGALAVLALVAQAAHAEPRPLTAADARAGKALYLQECSGCHGERGDGRGPAAEHIEPKPRNFVGAPFKLRTTASRQPPTTADVLRVIERGIPGTAMPSFRFLPEDDRRKIAAYVLQLAKVLDKPEPAAVAVDPKGLPPATPQSIARGKELFADAGCASCHGPLGKGDGPTANQMKDEEGRPVAPRDFTDGRFRGGGERLDLYYRLTTGMDGTPMPAYEDVLEPQDRWAVVDYVMTLQSPPAPQPLPDDPIAAGRVVAAKYSCGGCHVLDDGKGGSVGPDLRVSGQKLNPAWVKQFLADPRAAGKIYPWRPHRMPALGLTREEIDAMSAYLAAVGGRGEAPFTKPDPTQFPADKVDAGKLLFVVTCAQCHSLGKVVQTLPVNQQGPDLINVGDRVDYLWAKTWITNPKKVDPKTKMTIPQLNQQQVEEVRMFVWKAALEQPASASRGGGAAGGAREDAAVAAR
ncbi:MAG: c-type cytochrome [Thermodesulfobacteriota bacterium]